MVLLHLIILIYHNVNRGRWVSVWNVENAPKYESLNSSNKWYRRQFHEIMDLDVNVESCALQTLVEIVIFSVFHGKKLQKVRNLQQNSAKKRFFWVCTQTLVKCWKGFTLNIDFFGNKSLDQRLGANSKIMFFCWILLQISCFFSFF